MFLEVEWYWWLIIAVIPVISIPFKIKFMKWWSRRQERKDRQCGKWGDDEYRGQKSYFFLRKR